MIDSVVEAGRSDWKLAEGNFLYLNWGVDYMGVYMLELITHKICAYYYFWSYYTLIKVEVKGNIFSWIQFLESALIQYISLYTHRICIIACPSWMSFLLSTPVSQGLIPANSNFSLFLTGHLLRLQHVSVTVLSKSWK